MTAPATRPAAFYGRRKGHPLRPRQAALLDEMLPRLAIDLGKPAPADVRALFPPGIDDLRLEIGFGGGEHMIAQALAHPRTGIIGCEPFVNGMAKALAQIDEQHITTIRLHHGDAVELLAWLPDGALAGIDLLYPDPWPKRRHWKRRFVRAATIAEFARVLRPDGLFRFASDMPDYVDWTLARVLRAGTFDWTAERADDWREPWPGYLRTRYEAKAVREGRKSCYLSFKCRADQPRSNECALP